MVVVAIAAIVALVAVPRLSGGDALTVLSGSMEPTFSAGDVVVVAGADPATVCADVSIGSIVTFFPEPNDPTLVTHRVVGKTIGSFADGTDCRLVTQGDANSAIDAPVSPEQVRGTFLYGVPGIGWIRQWIAENPLPAAGGLAALVAAWLLWSPRRRRTTVIPAVPSSPAVPDGEVELRARELALRERELALRERELELALSRTPVQTGATAGRSAGADGPSGSDDLRLDTPLFEALEQVCATPNPAEPHRGIPDPDIGVSNDRLPARGALRPARPRHPPRRRASRRACRRRWWAHPARARRSRRPRRGPPSHPRGRTRGRERAPVRRRPRLGLGQRRDDGGVRRVEPLVDGRRRRR